MSKNLEMMKKLIEEKKQKGNSLSNNRRAEKSIGKSSKGVRIGNGGGVFDK